MPNYKIVHRAPALNQKREVRVSATATATPAGFSVLAASAALDLTNRKAIFHLVRDELYKIGVTNTQDLIINYETVASVPRTGAHIWETDVFVKIGAAVQVKPYHLLASQADVAVTVASGNSDIATVAYADGLITITGVAKGQTVVTVSALGESTKIQVDVYEPAMT